MSSYPFRIRAATPADKETVVRIARSFDPDDWVPYEYDNMLKDAAERHGLFVAEVEGQVVGCYAMEFSSATDAYFMAMRLDPAVQGKGLGSLLCRAQVEQAAGLGARQIYLLSNVENRAAHRTVEKNGFVNLGAYSVWAMDRIPALPAPRWSRPARGSDLPAVEQMLAGSAVSGADAVICIPESPWVVRTLTNEVWNPANLFVTGGEAGLEGFLAWSVAGPYLVIRRLEGSPEAAADLLAAAVAEAVRQECKGIDIGLSARCEPLLRPLGLTEQQRHPQFVFRATP